MTSLTIVRGLPGSGKSTLAKLFVTAYGALHYEADMYFVNNGAYEWDRTRIQQAHEWCQNKVAQALEFQRSVVVSNTFTTRKEMQFYLDLAQQHCIVPNIILCQTVWGNIHNVPVATIENMKRRFEYNI